MISKMLPVAALALLSAAGAWALPAECLIVVKGITQLDGKCELKLTGASGAFEAAGSGVKVAVTPAQGVWRATYSEPGNVIPLGEVKKAGECWTNPSTKICTWDPGQRPGSVNAAAKPAPAAAPAKPGKVYPRQYNVAGDWTITQVSSDPAGKKFNYCAAVFISGQEQAFRIAYNGRKIQYGFMGADTTATGKKATVGMWFDNRKVEREQLTVVFHIAPEDQSEWLVWEQEASEPGYKFQFRDASKITFAYRRQGREETLSLSLKGLKPAWQKLMDCGQPK